MRSLILSCIAFAFVLTGCSSGGSGTTPLPPPPAGPTAKIRFVNAATRMGTIAFAVGTTQVSVPARGASAELTVPVVETVVTATNGTAIGAQTFNFQEGWDFDIVAIESPAGALGLISIFGKEPNLDPATARLTYFNFDEAIAGQTDAYVVAPGTDITTVAPTFAGGGGTQSFAAGSYSLTITRAATKKILFQSAPFNLALGRNDVIIGAPATASDLKPQPFLVTWDEEARDLARAGP